MKNKKNHLKSNLTGIIYIDLQFKLQFYRYSSEPHLTMPHIFLVLLSEENYITGS